jgi:hypothetical protein
MPKVRSNRRLEPRAQVRHSVATGILLNAEGYVEHYNNVRLNSAIGYIAPKDLLAGRQQEIHDQRDRKLQAA